MRRTSISRDTSWRRAGKGSPMATPSIASVSRQTTDSAGDERDAAWPLPAAGGRAGKAPPDRPPAPSATVRRRHLVGIDIQYQLMDAFGAVVSSRVRTAVASGRV